jgi:hypothetical protein
LSGERFFLRLKQPCRSQKENERDADEELHISGRRGL